MPLRKSHLYSSLWKSCDELRGGMDASQYKDYILTVLCMKYVSDRYASDGDFADITVPAGGSFADMVALKGTKEIGEGMDVAIGELANPNEYLLGEVVREVDFNDESQLGQGEGEAGPHGGFSRGSIPSPNAPMPATHWATRASYLMCRLWSQSGRRKGPFYGLGGSLPYYVAGEGDRSGRLRRLRARGNASEAVADSDSRV